MRERERETEREREREGGGGKKKKGKELCTAPKKHGFLTTRPYLMFC